MSSSPVLPSLEDTFGYLFMGGIISTALWGIACAQLYFYYEHYSRMDKLWLRIYLSLIFLLDTTHQALLVQALYFYLVKEFGNFLNLLRPQKAFIDVTMFAALIDFMVQSVFLVRVWTLSKRNYVLTGVLTLPALGLFATCLVFYGQTYGVTDARRLLHFSTTARIMNGLVVASDTAIAAAMIFFLRSIRCGVKRTDNLLRRLVIYTIGTGAITSAWAVVGLVGAIVSPGSFLYLMVDVVIPKLYFNCVLASLNSRSKLRELVDAPDGLGISLDDIQYRTGRSYSSATLDKNKKPVAIECNVDIEVGHRVGMQSSTVVSRE